MLFHGYVSPDLVYSSDEFDVWLNEVFDALAFEPYASQAAAFGWKALVANSNSKAFKMTKQIDMKQVRWL